MLSWLKDKITYNKNNIKNDKYRYHAYPIPITHLLHSSPRPCSPSLRASSPTRSLAVASWPHLGLFFADWSPSSIQKAPSDPSQPCCSPVSTG